ncbi:COG3014 family protein [Vibrio sp. RC27]
MKLISRIALVILSALSLSACSNFSAGNLFSHYSAQHVDLHDYVSQGEYQQAQLAAQGDVAGDILDNFERGRVALLNQDNQASRKWLEQSDAAVTEKQQKAIVSLSESSNSVSGLITNDNLTDYEPADYELGFLHLYLALNYVVDNNLDDALVEFRRANQVQETAKDIRQDRFEKESTQLDSQGIRANVGSILAQYPTSTESLAAVQNGYLFFVSGLMYEADGNVNDAYIDYKRGLALQPNNRTLIESVIRCATKLSAFQDLDLLIAKYGHASSLNKDQARVIVVQEQGVVSALRSWKQSLPIYTGKGSILYSVSLPFYPDRLRGAFRSPIFNGEAIQGDLLTDVNEMAQYQLHERVSSTLLRQVARVVVKEQFRQQISKEDPLSGFLVNIFNTLTEQPDTRSWLTLPAEVYSATQIVEAGEVQLVVGGKKYEIQTKRQGTTLVWISRQSENAVVWHKQLGNL